LEAEDLEVDLAVDNLVEEDLEVKNLDADGLEVKDIDVEALEEDEPDGLSVVDLRLGFLVTGGSSSSTSSLARSRFKCLSLSLFLLCPFSLCFFTSNFFW
jgi:hypothetical protein